MIVVDASAALLALLSDGAARAALAADSLHAPHLVDSEVAHALRRRTAVGQLDAGNAWTALDTWRRLGITRHAALPYLGRIWSLRANMSAYDATYIGLAEALGCSLLTADARLSRAPNLRCTITLVPG